jgi:hypothetical protein
MNSWHNCDYCFFVGASRSAQVEDPDDLLPSRCPFFAEGARLQKEDSYWWEMVNRTYPASIRKDEEKDETD